MRIGGELDVLTIPTVRKCLNSQLAEQPSVLFLDLTGVEFLSTAAVRMMLEAREAGDRVGTVVLVMGALRRSVARALAVAGWPTPPVAGVREGCTPTESAAGIGPSGLVAVAARPCNGVGA